MKVVEHPLLLGGEAAAALIGVSKSAFYRLDKEGRVPRPKRFGRMRMWSRSDLLAWERAGCPTREEWETRS